MRNSKTFLYLRNKLQVLGSALTGNSLYKCAHRRTLQQKKAIGMRKIIILLFAMVMLPCAAQTEINLFKKGQGEGVTYYLPKTVLNITVEAECITHIPGEFSRYADRFLRITDAIDKEKKYWELTNVHLDTYGIPDPEKMFTVRLGGSNASNLIINKDGILESINCEAPQKSVEEVKRFKQKRVDARQYMTEEILQATSTSKMAELTAKEIYAIRESKIAITRGTADNMPQDGLSMQLVLEELNTQEKALTELFTGYIDTVKYTCNIKFTPSDSSYVSKEVLFRFSRKLGIVDKDNLAGKPIYYDFKNEHSIPATTISQKPAKREGVCYNLPGRAQTRIYTSGKVFFEDILPIAQFGSIETLAKNLFSKNFKTKVILDTATGGIIRIDK